MADSILDHAQTVIEQSREDEWLTVKQFAARRGVHVQTIYSVLRHRPDSFPYYAERVGRSIRILIPRGSIQGRKSA